MLQRFSGVQSGAWAVYAVALTCRRRERKQHSGVVGKRGTKTALPAKSFDESIAVQRPDWSDHGPLREQAQSIVQFLPRYFFRSPSIADATFRSWNCPFFYEGAYRRCHRRVVVVFYTGLLF